MTGEKVAAFSFDDGPKTQTMTGGVEKTKGKKKEVWGRAMTGSWLDAIIAFLMMASTPPIAYIFYIALASYGGSLSALFGDAFDWIVNSDHTFSNKSGWMPMPTARGFAIYFIWYFFQVACSLFVPGKIGYGQSTPAGHILPYKVNGLNVWFVTVAAYLGCSYGLGLFKPTIIADYWGELLWAANIWGLTLTVLAYIKAVTFPSHPGDCKWSGSVMYDMFMGAELNPRFGPAFDFKLFHNGRPGIVAWGLINFSFAVKQAEVMGTTWPTNGMIALNILHLVYILDFFYNEDWYLRTIDIAHDHFGFYLAWGDSVWLPWMYTLQSHYMLRNPEQLPTWAFVGIMALGAAGYYIFRAVNDQKDKFRSAADPDKHMIWGKKATYLRVKYQTGDGSTRTSTLLTSGFWGLSRHFNYVGDLMMSLSFCLCCGVKHLLPYFYIIYMTILLVHRVYRDQQRLSMKYGEDWKKYCAIVPWKILPYVF